MRTLILLGAVLAAGADEQAIPRLDRFGDPLPTGALVRMGSIRLRPDRPARGCAFAPDGKTLYSFGNGGVAHAWDPVTGKLLRRVPLPALDARCFALTADGKAFVVGCQDGTIHYIDPTTGAERRALTGAEPRMIHDLSLSADGQTLMSQHTDGTDADGTVVVWDVAAGKPRHKLPSARVLALAALLPDGKHLVLGKPNETLYLVDAVTGKDVRTFEPGPALRGAPAHRQRVLRVAVSPDGKRMAYGDWEQVTVCSVVTGKVVDRLDVPGERGFAFAPDGRFLAVGGRPGVRVWEFGSGKEPRLLDTTPPGNFTSLAYAPDGKTLAALGGSLRLWDIASGRELHPPVGHPDNASHLVFLGDGKHLVSWGSRDKQLVAWEVATGRKVDQVVGLPFHGAYLTPSGDGKGVQGLGFDHNLHVWRPGIGMETVRLGLSLSFKPQSAVSSDGKRLALVGNPGWILHLFDRAGTGRGGRGPVVLPDVEALLPIFTPDGRRLAVELMGGPVRVWDWGGATPREVRTLRPVSLVGDMGLITWPRIAPDGRSLLLLNLRDDGLDLCEVASGGKRAWIPGVPDGGFSAAWSPDGRRVARGDPDGTWHVFDAAGGKEVAKGEAGQGKVQSLAFNPDGRLLASGGADGTILLWEIPKVGKSLRALTEAQRTDLWADLADADAGRAYRAIAALSDAPDSALALLQERLKPRPTTPDVRRLEKLVGQLDSDSFAEREKASRELAEVGAAAEDVLQKALDREVTTEMRLRVGNLLERIPRRGIAPERLRSLRAIEVLERIGTPAAKQVLADLAKQGNDPMLVQDARNTLERLGERR